MDNKWISNPITESFAAFLRKIKWNSKNANVEVYDIVLTKKRRKKKIMIDKA